VCANFGVANHIPTLLTKDLLDFCLGHHLPITIQAKKFEINNIVNIYYKLVKQ